MIPKLPLRLRCDKKRMASHAATVLGRAVRETGQALERLGLSVIEKPLFKEPFSRHRNVANLFDKCVPRATAAGLAPVASVHTPYWRHPACAMRTWPMVGQHAPPPSAPPLR